MAEVRDNAAQNRFELEVEGMTAFANYRPQQGMITFVHTEVPSHLRNRGIGSQLAKGALEIARARGLKVVSRCSFMSNYLAAHPEFSDLVAR